MLILLIFFPTPTYTAANWNRKVVLARLPVKTLHWRATHSGNTDEAKLGKRLGEMIEMIEMIGIIEITEPTNNL